MDRLERYREIVGRVIEEYARYKPSHGRIETEAVVDRDRDRYEVLHVGWDGVRRVHGSVVHIDIIDSKVWVQYDGTNFQMLSPVGTPASITTTTKTVYVTGTSSTQLSNPTSLTSDFLTSAPRVQASS